MPVKLGYHSPTSAPKILIEAALFEAGLRLTGDANATKGEADVLLVDLKSVANFNSALTSGQVDFWVAPAPTPQVAVLKKQGKMILDFKNPSSRREVGSLPLLRNGGSYEYHRNTPGCFESLYGAADEVERVVQRE